jgi:signal transduction histidine kinase
MTLDAPTTNSDVRAAQQRIEELGRIILAYSDVTEKLQRSHEQLTQTVGRLRAELGDKNRQLERRNRLAALGEMAAGMAHEIRNPLGAIQLYAGMLAADLAAQPESARTVEKIRWGVRRMEEIVSKVLNFSKDLRISLIDGDVAAMAREVGELASSKAIERGVRLDISGPDAVAGRFDRVMMCQAALNLVVNGIEATPAGRCVHVTYGTSGERCFLRVEDEGAGVPADVMDRVFNPFFTTKDEGTGLGLAIVHRVVEAHEGTVTVRNAPGGGGAIFEVRW